MNEENGNAFSEKWSFRFRAEEVPRRRPVSGPMPDILLPTLSLYMRSRPKLIKGNDPGTLFLNRNGGELSSLRLLLLVSDITERYVGKRISPAAFRTIFSYYWLSRKHRTDRYVTLASILWESVHGTRFRYDAKYRAAYKARMGTKKRARKK